MYYSLLTKDGEVLISYQSSHIAKEELESALEEHHHPDKELVIVAHNREDVIEGDVIFASDRYTNG